MKETKSKFSELVERTLANGAQIVTRRGRKTIVLLPCEEYENLTGRKGQLSQFLNDSPLSGSGMSIERAKDPPRPVDVEP